MDTNIFFISGISKNEHETDTDASRYGLCILYKKHNAQGNLCKNYPVRYKEEVLKKGNVRREKKQHPDKTY